MDLLKIDYTWNPAFNFIMKLKRTYQNKFGDIDVYNLEHWIEQLDMQEYNDFLSRVNLTHTEAGWVLIKYSIINVGRDMWKDKNSMYREMRSIVIDLVNDAIVAVPFPKFFNLEEVEETSLENVIANIEKADSVDISNKLDGSMQFARWYNGQVVMFGAKAMEDHNSFRLAEGRNWLMKKYPKFLALMKTFPETTFIFEYISANDKHVVNYSDDEQGLYLIGMRDVREGKVLQSRYVKCIAEQTDIPFAQLEESSINDLLRKAKTYRSDQKEGWVLNIDGNLVKIKCDDYVNIHRVLTKVSSINLVIRSIADGKYDDLIAKVPDVYRNRVEKVAKLISEYALNTEQEIQEWYRKAPKKDRKNLAAWINSSVPKKYRGYVWKKYDNKEYNLLKQFEDTDNPKYITMRQMGYTMEYSAIFGENE